MILCLDAGNTQIYGGLFDGPNLKLQFRFNSRANASSDEYGTFLRSVIRENGFEPEAVEQIAVSTVVPEIIHSLRGGCTKYFNRTPFVLQVGSKTGLRVKYRNPAELGSDRIATAIAAVERFQDKNLLIVDLGTAITISAVGKDKDYYGGAILPGLRIAMEALENNTSRLPAVEIKKMDGALGRSTVESIQSGLYYGTLGAIREIESRLRKEVFEGEKPLILGTGGFSLLYEKAGLFDHVLPDLILHGLYSALKMNS